VDGWALGSVEPGDPRWALVGDHALDGQAFCLHRHRDDIEWPPRCQRGHCPLVGAHPSLHGPASGPKHLSLRGGDIHRLQG
jgi:hypothetical protein